MMYRRLRLYLFGCLLGVVLSWVFFRERLFFSWLPKTVVKEEIVENEMTINPALSEKLKSLKMEKYDLKVLIQKGEIDFSKSETQKKPCPLYFISLSHKHIKSLNIQVCEGRSHIVEQSFIYD